MFTIQNLEVTAAAPRAESKARPRDQLSSPTARTNDAINAGFRLICVSDAITTMDRKFGADFTNWAQDERHLAIVVPNFVRIAQGQTMPQVVQAVQWLSDNWTLKSRICLLQNLTQSWIRADEIGHLCKMVAGKWKAIYQAELVHALLTRWSCDKAAQIRFLQALMDGWQFSQISLLFLRLGVRVEWHVKSSIFRWYRETAKLMHPQRETVQQLCARTASAQLLPAGPPTTREALQPYRK